MKIQGIKVKNIKGDFYRLKIHIQDGELFGKIYKIKNKKIILNNPIKTQEDYNLLESVFYNFELPY